MDDDFYFIIEIIFIFKKLLDYKVKKQNIIRKRLQ